MKHTSVLLDANNPTANGNYYPPDLLKKIAESSQTMIHEGRLFVEYFDRKKPLAGWVTELANVGCVVTGMWVEDGKLMVTIETLKTKSGFRAETLIESKDFTVRPKGYGTVTEQGYLRIVGNDYTLVCLTIQPTKDDWESVE